MRPAVCLPFLLAMATLASTPAHGNAEAWRIDPVHSRVLLEVDHAGFSASMGTLSNPVGELWFDPDDWQSARVDVRLPLARLDFGDAEWNATLVGTRWLDAAAFPEIRFRSIRVEPTGEQRARVIGELTVRGQTREVVLDVQRHALKRHPLTLRRTVGFSATTTLDRRDFGLDAFPRMIGTQVQVRLVVEATRTRAPTDTAPEPATDAADQHR